MKPIARANHLVQVFRRLFREGRRLGFYHYHAQQEFLSQRTCLGRGEQKTEPIQNDWEFCQHSLQR